MRGWLYAIASRVGMPVYRIEQEMPAHELREWVLFMQEEARAMHGPPPQNIEDVGVEGMALALGVKPDGS